MRRHPIALALILCALAACDPAPPDATPQAPPATAVRLGDLLEEGVVVQMQVVWEAPGLLLHTLEADRPRVGSLQVRVVDDGAVEAAVYDPDSERSDADGWVRQSSGARLAPGQPHRVTVAIGPSLIVLVDAAEQARIAAPLPWPAQALYLGTFQEAAFASGADAPTGASGQVLVERVGPGDADFGLVTLEHRATALEATAPQEAARISRRMVELQPRQAPGHYARARARVRLGDLDAARADLDAALASDPAPAQAWRLRGWLRHQQGDLAGALVDIERYLEIEEDPQARQWLADWRQGSPAEPVAGDTRELQPSDQAQVLTFDGGLRITVPPELMASPARLSVDSGAAAPAPLAAGLHRLAGYEVTLGNQHDLPGELRLTLPYDPASLPEGLPLEASLIAGRLDRLSNTWTELPLDVEPATTSLTVRTRHLSWIEVYHLGSGYRILPGGTFGVFFDEGQVRAAKEDPDPANTYQARHPSTTPGVPDFVSDVHGFASVALETYAGHGLQPYDSPVWILVCGAGHSGYNRVLRRVFITFDAGTWPELQYAVAHELFHAVQLADYGTLEFLEGAHAWWLEASAEYAGARLVRHYSKMGKLTEAQFLPAKFLVQPVAYFGATHELPLERYHQYQEAHLLEWLATAARRADEPGVEHTWVAMYKHVASHKSLGAIGAIDDFLRQRLGPARGFDHHFRRFALHYLLDPASPMGRSMVAETGRGRTAVVGDGVHPVAIESTRRADLRDGRTLEFGFWAGAGHTARMWAFDLTPASGSFEASLPEPMPSRSALYLARLPNGNRTGHEIVARFETADDRTSEFALQAHDRLVAILVNDGSENADAAMRLRVAPEPTAATCTPLRVCGFDGMWVSLMRDACDKCAAGDTSLDSCGACDRFKLAVDRCAGAGPWIPDDGSWLARAGGLDGLRQAYRSGGPHDVNVGYFDSLASHACYELLPGAER